MDQIMQPNDLSFIVALPMYNEEACAERCIRAVFGVLDSIGIANAVVAVNDGSRDNTLRILEGLRPAFRRLHIVDHPVNRGYGGAIKSAYAFAIKHAYDYVLFMDADLTQDPRYIRDFVPHMIDGIDIIKASRYIRGSQVLGVPARRILVSSVGNAFARVAFGLPITDYTNGFRAIGTRVAKHFDLQENHFAILVEEIWQAKYLARTYAEVKYSLSTREDAAGSKFKYNLRVYRAYLRYCLLSLFRIGPAFTAHQEDESNVQNRSDFM